MAEKEKDAVSAATQTTTKGATEADVESHPDASHLPDGCTYGTLNGERVIWVEFPPGSTDNPFYFTSARKFAIVVCAVFFTALASYTQSAYTIAIPSMCADLGCTQLQANAGLAVFVWAFGMFPLFLAPLSEEFGRKWTYIAAVVAFCLLQLMMTLGTNTATVLVCRFLLGGAGSIGATLVGGTISDIFVPARRGLPMAVFGFSAVFFMGLGGATNVFVEVNKRMGWRWVAWIQFSVYVPIVIVVMRETRETVILRRRAAKLRKERGDQDGGTYMARSEVTKPSFATAVRTSCVRPLVFLTTEPLVMFFSVWVALGWGCFYVAVSGIPYIFKELHGFEIVASAQAYWAICIGAVFGLGFNFLNERVYRAKAPQKGVDARLYAPMAAGIMFAVGCFITGFTSLPSVHWIGPCVGIAVVLTAILTIYITVFTYLSECYGSYASSAMSAQSFLRNTFAGMFTFLTAPMFHRLTVRWSLVLIGGVAALLALVPFAAFFYGPQIRAKSKYSRLLMQEEKERLEDENRKRAGQMGQAEIIREEVEEMERRESIRRVRSGESAFSVV